MQIVIDIPEKTVNEIKDNAMFAGTIPSEILWDVTSAIVNSTPLPKGHGDLIDRNKIEYLKALHDLKWNKITANECATKIKYSASTIIEADEEAERSDEE